VIGLKGFTKDGKFRPTEKKRGASIKILEGRGKGRQYVDETMAYNLKKRKDESLDSTEDEDRLTGYMNDDDGVQWKLKEIKEMTSTKEALLDFKSSGKQLIDEYDIENFNVGDYDDYDSGHYVYRYSVNRMVDSIDEQVETLQEEVDWTEKYYSNLVNHSGSIVSPISKSIDELSDQFYESEIDQSLITDEFEHVSDPNREGNKEYYEKLDHWDIDDEIAKIREYISKDLTRRNAKLNAKWFTYDQNQYVTDKSKRRYAIKKLEELEEHQNHIKSVYQKELNLYDYLTKLKNREKN